MRVWDYDRWDRVTARHIQPARETGALSELPLALASRAFVLLFGGELTAVALLTGEMQAVKEATGSIKATQGNQGDPSRVEHSRFRSANLEGSDLVVHCSAWITVVVTHWPGHLEVSAFAPTPEQGASRWPPIIANRNSAGSPWAMFSTTYTQKSVSVSAASTWVVSSHGS
jgi:hypothetical protein